MSKEYTEPFYVPFEFRERLPWLNGRMYLPALEQAMETPQQEVIKFYKNIDDKTELFLREKLADIQRELQEHFSQIHSDKKTNINKDIDIIDEIDLSPSTDDPVTK